MGIFGIQDDLPSLHLTFPPLGRLYRPIFRFQPFVFRGEHVIPCQKQHTLTYADCLTLSWGFLTCQIGISANRILGVTILVTRVLGGDGSFFFELW